MSIGELQPGHVEVGRSRGEEYKRTGRSRLSDKRRSSGTAERALLKLAPQQSLKGKALTQFRPVQAEVGTQRVQILCPPRR
jgi:hypothetical protein